jgi:ankyrin repeat protein
MLALQNGHTEALTLLLVNGANVNAADQVPQNLFTISHEFDSKYTTKYIRLSHSLCI